MKTQVNLLQARLVRGMALGMVSTLSVIATAEHPADTAPAKTSIPWSQIGAKAGADYQGDGLAVTPTAEGARLRCVFQRLEGEATREGLWLTSTVTNGVRDRFRVVAAAVGREGGVERGSVERGASERLRFEGSVHAPLSDALRSDAPRLARTGTVSIDGQIVRFTRSRLVEEYSVSMDGVRQDFVVRERPAGTGELAVRLAVSGATVQATASGAQLVLENSGRKLAYSRLRATDAKGSELPARIHVEEKQDCPPTDAPRSHASTLHAPAITTVVDDKGATYPIRIDPTFSDANWISISGISGANGGVSAAVVDGFNLYIGGQFIFVGDVTANYVARWNGSGWSALGSGMNGSVSALAVGGNDLYAAGSFTTAGGTPANGVAKWDGSSWSALGSGVGAAPDYPYYGGGVAALAVSGSDVYAAGSFTTAGGSAATNLAKWDGSTWGALGSGLPGSAYFDQTNTSVSALAVLGTNLYAAGIFNDGAFSEIFEWDGSRWTALGSGMNGPVNALAVSGSDVYTGGNLISVGGNAAAFVAKWNGSTWTNLGSGMNGPVYTLAVSGSEVYAGGGFTTAGGGAANYIAKWNESGWTNLGSGMEGAYPYVNALAVSASEVYAGGLFTTASGTAANYILKWNGNSWSALGSGMNGDVNALLVSGGDLYAGGEFTIAGGTAANNIAKWNGNRWSRLGSGLSGGSAGTVVWALAASGSDVYAGGEFTVAGGIAATNIAKWDGSSWSALGSGMGGAYANSSIWALAVSGTDLYAGGEFFTAGGIAANRVAKWDGSSWSALGSGMDYPVHSLAVWSNIVYAGGQFFMAGGIPATNIAKWNGSTWTNLGSGMNGPVDTLAVSGGEVYAGGGFTTAGGGGANCIAKWDGTNWSALGSGVSGGSLSGTYVSALAVSGSDLYVGGNFTTAGGKVSAYVAKAVVNPPVLAIEPDGGGGYFLRFEGVPGSAYRLERAPSLAGPWATSSPQTAPASGFLEFWDVFPPPGQGFYRSVGP